MQQINRTMALPFVAFAVDDALCQHVPGRVVDHPDARLVGFSTGYDMVFVACWSYLPDVTLDAEEACEMAIDLLLEKCWFADPDDPQACQPVVVL